MQLAIFCDQSKTSTYKGTYLNEQSSENQFLVNIPIYQTSQATKVYAWATMCYEKGSSNIYSTDEIVVVDFINDELNYPIIVGKFYKKNEIATKENITIDTKENITIDKKVNSITAYGDSNFNIQGFKLYIEQKKDEAAIVDIPTEVTGTQLANLVQLVTQQQEKINALEEAIKSLQGKAV